MNFELMLSVAVLVTGGIALVDRLLWAKARAERGSSRPRIIEYAYSFFPMLLLVWGIRSFVVQPYRVPTGSLTLTRTLAIVPLWDSDYP